MELSKIEIGSPLEIYIRRDGYNYKVTSRVEYADDKMIGVPPIASKTRLFKFNDDDVVDIVLKQDGKNVKFSGVKAGYTQLENGTGLHTFIPAKEPEGFNRRTAFRLDINARITISYEKPFFREDQGEALNGTMAPEKRTGKEDDNDRTLEEALEKISARYCELTAVAFLKDISETGAAISSDALLEKGDLVYFEFMLAAQNVSLRAVVVRVKKDAADEVFQNYYGLSFVETSKDFVKAFFAEQRKSINRNRINTKL